MKRSIMHVGWTLGSAALFALGMGCSHQEKPTQTPTAGATTPPFESNVPPGPAGQAQQPGAPNEPGAPPGPGAEAPPMPAPLGAPPPPAGAPPPGAQGAPPMGGPEGMRGTPEQPGMGPGATAGGQSERQMCDTLNTAAKIHVEDVKNGVAIVLAPKAGHNIGSVRDQAQQLQGAMHRAPTEGQAGGEMCGIVSLGRLPGVNTQVTEGQNTVRIMMTTPNPPEVRDLRRSAREQVNNMTKQGGR